MNYCTFVTSQSDLLLASQTSGLNEVLLEPSLLAREGKLKREEVEALAVKAQELNLQRVLVWDVMMTNSEFLSCSEEVKKYNLENYSAIRVQCPGAAIWVKENFPQMPLQFIAETGNNNYLSLEAWVRNLQPSLSRLILNIQLPEEKLCEYIKRLPVECEILGVGRILLFYSRRKLLQPNFDSLNQDQENPWMEIIADSSDSHHREFPVIENRHGTFMYLDKDQFILDRLQNLQEAGLHAVRIDLRHLSEEGNSADGILDICSKILTDSKELRLSWPRKVIAPFFKSNLTTKQFSKLKPKIKAERNEDYLAEVISTVSGKLVAIYVLNDFKIDTKLSLSTPNGVTNECGQLEFCDMSGAKLLECKKNQLVITSWVKGATLGAVLKRDL